MAPWGWTLLTVMFAVICAVCLIITLRAERRIRHQRGLLLRSLMQFQEVIGAMQPPDGPLCERCGIRFLQTGPQSWEHVYCPAAS